MSTNISVPHYCQLFCNAQALSSNPTQQTKYSFIYINSPGAAEKEQKRAEQTCRSFLQIWGSIHLELILKQAFEIG